MMAHFNRSLLVSILLSCMARQAVADGDEGGSSEDLQNKILIAHGVLGSAAFIVFFPLGAVIMRILKGSSAWKTHAALQLFSLGLLTATTGLGIWLADETEELDEYHPIIGLVLFTVLWLQAVWGLLSHWLNAKYQKRTFFAYGHIWLGRTLITLGIINGGLGLLLADDAERGEYIAYGVIAGVVWLAFMGFSIWSDVTRPPKTRKWRNSDHVEDVGGNESEKSDS